MYKQILIDLSSNRYMKRYIKLIEAYKENDCPVFEKHHILPRCIFKEYVESEWNIIKLPPRVHYIAHFLLYKANIDTKLTFAFNMMNMTSKNQTERLKSNILNHSKLYESFKEDMITAIKESNTNMVTVFDKNISENVRITCDEFYENREKYKHYNEGNVLVLGEDGKYTTVKQSVFDSNVHKAAAKGLVNVIDKDGISLRVSLNDPRYISGELSTIKTNSIFVTDENGEKCRISSAEYSINRDKYTHHSANKVIVTDNDGNKISMTSEEFENSDYEFHTKNKVTVKDKDGNITSVSTDDPRYLNGEFIFHGVGKVSVKDNDGKSVFITTEEFRNNKDKYTHNTTGKTIVKDSTGNLYRVSVEDPRYLNGEFVGSQKGTVTVKDKFGVNLRVSLDDPRYLTGELIPVSKGLKWYYDPVSKMRSLYNEGEQPEGYLRGMGAKNCVKK